VTPPEPLLEVDGLRKWFPVRRGAFGRRQVNVRAVDDVSFVVPSHQVLGLAGESGSGKTTIGRTVLRLIEPTAGRIRFDGHDVTTMDAAELRRFRRRAQIVFQDPFAALNPTMTIEAILSEPLRIQGLAGSASARRDKAVEMLEAVSLSSDHLNRLPSALSGGQRQRVCIARALAVNPDFIVADEPVSALDVSIQAQIVNLLADLRVRFGLALLFISHDLAVMEYLSDRIAVVYLGRIMEIGPAGELCRNPKHPYTEALLSAVPAGRAGTRRARVVLSGDLPDPADPPSGCVFRTRCRYALPECAQIVPRLRGESGDHLSACIRDDVP